MRTARLFGSLLLVAVSVGALAAPLIAPRGPDESLRGLLNAPPTMPHVRDDAGGWHPPFIYPWRLVSQLERRYEQVRSDRVTLEWFIGGTCGDAVVDTGTSGKVRVTVSVGVSSYPENGKSHEDLVSVADQALYRAKGSGKNLVCIV